MQLILYPYVGWYVCALKPYMHILWFLKGLSKRWIWLVELTTNRWTLADGGLSGTCRMHTYAIMIPVDWIYPWYYSSFFIKYHVVNLVLFLNHNGNHEGNHEDFAAYQPTYPTYVPPKSNLTMCVWMVYYLIPYQYERLFVCMAYPPLPPPPLPTLQHVYRPTVSQAANQNTRIWYIISPYTELPLAISRTHCSTPMAEFWMSFRRNSRKLTMIHR